jgi:hypothetical protein
VVRNHSQHRDAGGRSALRLALLGLAQRFIGHSPCGHRPSDVSRDEFEVDHRDEEAAAVPEPDDIASDAEAIDYALRSVRECGGSIASPPGDETHDDPPIPAATHYALARFVEQQSLVIGRAKWFLDRGQLANAARELERGMALDAARRETPIWCR